MCPTGTWVRGEWWAEIDVCQRAHCARWHASRACILRHVLCVRFRRSVGRRLSAVRSDGASAADEKCRRRQEDRQTVGDVESEETSHTPGRHRRRHLCSLLAPHAGSPLQYKIFKHSSVSVLHRAQRLTTNISFRVETAERRFSFWSERVEKIFNKSYKTSCSLSYSPPIGESSVFSQTPSSNVTDADVRDHCIASAMAMAIHSFSQFFGLFLTKTPRTNFYTLKNR